MVYLDNASTEPVCDAVLRNIVDMAKDYYNASSVYESGLKNMKDIDEVKEKISEMINCKPSEIIFTSCTSESNSMAIDGFLKRHGMHDVCCSNIEHSSILNNPNIVTVINCDNKGILHEEDFELYENTLFAISHVNNEIGTIADIKAISDAIRSGRNNYLLVDCAQSFGKIKIDVEEMGIDMLTFCGNKIGALKGVGVLYVREGTDIAPIVYGTQNDLLRGGTFNDLAIKSLGIAIDNLQDDFKYVSGLNHYMLSRLYEIDKDIFVNGDVINRSPYNLNVCIPNVSINNQQIASILDMEGYQVSAGSACHSGSSLPSHVLKAIGLSDDEANRSIRITFSGKNTKDEIDGFIECLNNIINMYKAE